MTPRIHAHDITHSKQDAARKTGSTYPNDESNSCRARCYWENVHCGYINRGVRRTGLPLLHRSHYRSPMEVQISKSERTYTALGLQVRLTARFSFFLGRGLGLWLGLG